MCNCKFKLGTMGQLEGNYPVILSAQNIAANKTKEVMLCIYHTSPSKFRNAFSLFRLNGEPLKVTNEEDVIELANTHDTGNDIKVFNNDFLKVAKDVSKTFTQAELDGASCTIALSIN